MLKPTSKAATKSFLNKSYPYDFWNIHRKTPAFESLFNKVAVRQDCRKTYLLHAHLRFYFSLGKTLKNFNQRSINYVLLKNVKCKVMFRVEHLQRSFLQK